MPAPVRSSSRARPAQSSSSTSGLAVGVARALEGEPPQPLALARARRREVDDEAEPADERGVEVPLAVRGQDGDAVELLHPLEHVVDLDVRVPVVGVASPGSACRTARPPRRTAAAPGARSHASNSSRRCFSVSPMYLLTTPARSTRYRSSPSERARTCAAIVLPVPLGPANSAVVPRPSEVSREKPQSSSTWPRSRACASSSRRCAAVAGASTRSDHVYGSGSGLSSSGVPAISSRRQTSPTSRRRRARRGRRGGSRRAAAPTRRPPRGRARRSVRTTAAAGRAGRSGRSGPSAGSTGTRRAAGRRGLVTDRNVSGAAGTASPQLCGQGVGVFPGQDRAVQAAAARPRGSRRPTASARAASAAASTATSRAPSLAAA